MKKQKRKRTTESKSFDLYEALRAALRDLALIDSLIPRESSRSSVLGTNAGEGNYIIDARKNDALGYIQTICRDHLHFGGRVLERGWKEGQNYDWSKTKPWEHS